MKINGYFKWLSSLLSIIILFFLLAYGYGDLNSRVNQHEKSIEKQEKYNKEIRDDIKDVLKKLNIIEGYVDGRFKASR